MICECGGEMKPDGLVRLNQDEEGILQRCYNCGKEKVTDIGNYSRENG